MHKVIAALATVLIAVPTPLTDWTWPLDGPAPRVVHTFEPPEEPWLPGHRGVDLAGKPGDVVRTAGAGTVGYAGLIAGVGVVTVSHGVVRTTYQPVAPDVLVGQRVETGEPIGVLTAAGSHCRPDTCLHWGLLQGTDYLDPLRLMSHAGPPRLLPLGNEAITPAGSPTSRATTPTDITARAAAGAMAGIAT